MVTMKDRKICPLCGERFAISLQGSYDGEEVECLSCGKFKITGTAKSLVSNYKEKYLLSGLARRSWDLDGRIVEIQSTNLQALVESVRIPDNPIESIDYILRYLSQISKVGRRIDLQPKDYPIVFAESFEQFSYYLKTMSSLGYVSIDHSSDKKGYRIEVKGWERLLEIEKQYQKTGSVFIAMWFDKSMDEAWEKGFKPAIKHLGLQPIRVDFIEHNGKICDRIISEIRKCSLLVADFTGNRGGVYFETGFALGLGIPVIWTCRNDYLKKGVHFDTRQYNHIGWKTVEELKNKLVNRIEASLPYITTRNSILQKNGS